MLHRALVALSICLLGAGEPELAAQDIAVPLADGRRASYTLQLPPDAKPDQTRPIVISLSGTDRFALPEAARDSLTESGWTIASTTSTGDDLAAILNHLRLRHRLEGQRFFVVGEGDAPDWPARIRGHVRYVRAQGDPIEALQRARQRDPLTTDLEAVLDDFHDAASKGDGARYFGHMTNDGAFLGTDGGERWSSDEMRETFAPYFKGRSAWIYVPQDRTVRIRGDVAWFDEALHSDSYGPCRGSGCLVRTGEGADARWKILLYHLSIPVPNELSRSIVAQIERADASPELTTVILVRHAEKEQNGRNPELTDEGRERAARLTGHLRSAGVDVIYSTPFKRTKQTVAPLSEALGLDTTIYAPRTNLGAKILTEHRGQTVLVSGHSNTVPATLARLGIENPPTLGESDYDNLYVVTIADVGPPRLLRLRY